VRSYFTVNSQGRTLCPPLSCVASLFAFSRIFLAKEYLKTNDRGS
jgi:hypothetical protein